MTLGKKKFDPYSHKSLVPASRNQIYAEMEDITKEEHLLEMNEFAFVRRDTSIGDIYNIYINNIHPPAIDMLRVHEYGHIRFSHFRYNEQKAQAIENSVKREWEKIKHHFADDVTPDQAAKWLGMQLNNILMDFEVNSKLFTPAEYDTMMYLTDDVLIKQREKWAADTDPKNAERAKNAQVEYDEFCKIKKKDHTKHLCQLCWPENYDMPLGLDYEAYVVLAIKNLDKFINEMKNNMAAQMAAAMQGAGQNQQQGQNGQGQMQGQQGMPMPGQPGNMSGGSAGGKGNKPSNQAGGGNGNQQQNQQGQNQQQQGQGNQNGQGGNGNGNQPSNQQGNGGGGKNPGKITSQIIKKSKNNAYEVADSGSANDIGTGGKDSGPGCGKNQGNGKGDGPNRSDTDADMSNSGGHGWDRSGNSSKPVPVSVGLEISDMMKFILNHAFAKAKTFVVRDQMYNYNRRKHSGTVIIPKNKTIEHYQLSNVVVIIDTSGSVSVKSVEDTLACLKAMRGKFNPNKSHVISWDTHLVEDTLWKELHVDYSQGGTNIANGIEYAKKYCKKDNDKLFVVSDFEDDMEDWSRALKDIPGEKYGILTMYKGNVDPSDPASVDKNNKKIINEVRSQGYATVGFNEIFAYQY